jgi:hypothetical protein
MHAAPRNGGLPRSPSPLRQALAGLCIVACLTAVAVCFWHQDWRYARIQASPPGWTGPDAGERVGLAPGLAPVAAGLLGGRPLLLHFYNPACPCSRFNLPKLRELVRRHGQHFDLVLLVESAEDRPLRRAPTGFPAEPTTLVDPQGRIAAHYGVHTTPQAVLLDGEGRLVYRGNYASGRACVDPSREYVRLALEALVADTPRAPVPAAPPAYGCPLPVLSAPVMAPGGEA